MEDSDHRPSVRQVPSFFVSTSSRHPYPGSIAYLSEYWFYIDKTMCPLRWDSFYI